MLLMKSEIMDEMIPEKEKTNMIKTKRRVETGIVDSGKGVRCVWFTTWSGDFRKKFFLFFLTNYTLLYPSII